MVMAAYSLFVAIRGRLHELVSYTLLRQGDRHSAEIKVATLVWQPAAVANAMSRLPVPDRATTMDCALSSQTQEMHELAEHTVVQDRAAPCTEYL